MRGALFVLALLTLGAGCGGDDEPSASGGGDCDSVEAPAPREPGTLTAPTDPLDDGTSYGLVFETSCGTFTVGLDTGLAPNTAASLVALAREGYFDDTIFHRIVPDFVIQGGDPTQTGSGGPGYKTVDEPPAGSKYVKGVVAMAKTQAEAPGTSGSQFFVVTADEAPLTSDYAIVGEVTEGLDVVERIGALGGPDEQPTQPVVISGVTVTES
ncbi:MAG: peptidylprolyl isomerase [Actinomycetota bacterium]|nr:peptidylprolyl isomerase [Actinomycetota bacterium]